MGLIQRATDFGSAGLTWAENGFRGPPRFAQFMFAAGMMFMVWPIALLLCAGGDLDD